MPGVTTRDTSYVAHIVALDAAGGLHVHLLAGLLADQRAAERRAVGDLAGLDVGLVLADDLPGRLLAAVLLDVHRGAEHAAALGIDQPRVDLLRVGELRLDVADARLDEALALARRVVLGVLGQVAVRARIGDRLGHRRPLDAPQPLQLFAQLRRAGSSGSSACQEVTAGSAAARRSFACRSCRR